LVRADGEENDRFVRQSLAEAETAFGHLAAFFTDYEDEAEVASETGTATAAQVEATRLLA